MVVHALHFHHFRVFGELAGKLAHGAVPSGGEKQGLAICGGGGHDGFDVVDKAHIEHAVCFIENQHFEAVEIDAAAAHMVHQAAGCGHHNINRAAEGADLLAERRAAHEGDGAQPFHVGSVGEGAFFNLGGQFAGGGEHQRARAFAGLVAAVAELLECGQQKGGGFARAGLRRGHDVTLVERMRNGLCLNRSGRFVAGRS